MSDEALIAHARELAGPNFSTHTWVLDAAETLLKLADALEKYKENEHGCLEVGILEETNEVVINLGKEMMGHIVFSVDQAHNLARVLSRKAVEAEELAKGQS